MSNIDNYTLCPKKYPSKQIAVTQYKLFSFVWNFA